MKMEIDKIRNNAPSIETNDTTFLLSKINTKDDDVPGNGAQDGIRFTHI